MNNILPGRPAGRPVWHGPIPDRYYYVCKNPILRPGSFTVPFTDKLEYVEFVRQINTLVGGEFSLIESEVPLTFVSENAGKLRRHSVVDMIYEKMQSSKPVPRGDADVGKDPIPGKAVKPEELWQL